MITKPDHDETESRWLHVADQLKAGREAINTGAERTRQAGQKIVKWYLIGIFGFGFFASLLTSGRAGFVIGMLLLFGIGWRWRKRAAQA